MVEVVLCGGSRRSSVMMVLQAVRALVACSDVILLCTTTGILTDKLRCRSDLPSMPFTISSSPRIDSPPTFRMGRRSPTLCRAEMF